MGTGKMHVVERGKGQKMEMETTKGGASHLDDMLALRLHDRQPLALDEIVCAAREEILRQWPSDDGRGLWMVGRGTGKIGGEGGSGESEPGEQRAKGAPWAAKQQVNLASPSRGAADTQQVNLASHRKAQPTTLQRQGDTNPAASQSRFPIARRRRPLFNDKATQTLPHLAVEQIDGSVVCGENGGVAVDGKDCTLHRRVGVVQGGVVQALCRIVLAERRKTAGGCCVAAMERRRVTRGAVRAARERERRGTEHARLKAHLLLMQS